MKVQILGIGNSILTDDSAGVRVVEKLRHDPSCKNCILTDGGTGGLGIVDLLEPCKKLIVVDAFVTGALPGTIHTLGLEDLAAKRSVHLSSAHGFDFMTTIELLRKTYPEKTPDEIIIIGIEAKDVTSFSESCSSEVAAAIDLAVQNIIAMLN